MYHRLCSYFTLRVRDPGLYMHMLIIAPTLLHIAASGYAQHKQEEKPYRRMLLWIIA